MSFEIPRAVLALPIGLIDRWRIDGCASPARPRVVGIDIIDVHEETSIRNIRDQRGIEPMLAVAREEGYKKQGGSKKQDPPYVLRLSTIDCGLSTLD